MSGLFIDSCQHYDNNSIGAKYNEVGGLSVGAAPANFGQSGNCLILGPNGGFTKVLQNDSTFIVGFRCLLDYPVAPNGVLYRGGCILTNSAFQQIIELQALQDSTFAVYANNTLVCNTDPRLFTIASGIPFYIELKYNLSSDGNILVSATVRVNGQIIGSGGPTDTEVLTDDNINQTAVLDTHSFATASGAGNTYIRDIYIFDQTGSLNNNFIGDVSIQAIYPRQDVDTSWSTFPAGSPNHFSLINEHPPDNDTTYIYDNNLMDTDSWFFQLISTFVGTILGIQYLLYARKDAEGARSIQMLVGSYSDPNIQYLADFYRYYMRFYDQSPTQGPLTPAIVNATAFGVILNS